MTTKAQIGERNVQLAWRRQGIVGFAVVHDGQPWSGKLYRSAARAARDAERIGGRLGAVRADGVLFSVVGDRAGAPLANNDLYATPGHPVRLDMRLRSPRYRVNHQPRARR